MDLLRYYNSGPFWSSFPPKTFILRREKITTSVSCMALDVAIVHDSNKYAQTRQRRVKSRCSAQVSSKTEERCFEIASRRSDSFSTNSRSDRITERAMNRVIAVSLSNGSALLWKTSVLTGWKV